MSVTIDLEPDVELELNSRASSAGVTLSEFLAAMVRREVGQSQQMPRPKNLMDLAAPIRELGGIELDLSRPPSYARDIDFS